MICRTCGSLNAHYEYLDNEISSGGQSLSESNIESVYCPDCEGILFNDQDFLYKVIDWLSEIGHANAEELPELTCLCHFPDGSLVSGKVVDDEDGLRLEREEP